MWFITVFHFWTFSSSPKFLILLNLLNSLLDNNFTQESFIWFEYLLYLSTLFLLNISVFYFLKNAILSIYATQEQNICIHTFSLGSIFLHLWYKQTLRTTVALPHDKPAPCWSLQDRQLMNCKKLLHYSIALHIVFVGHGGSVVGSVPLPCVQRVAVRILL